MTFRLAVVVVVVLLAGLLVAAERHNGVHDPKIVAAGRPVLAATPVRMAGEPGLVTTRQAAPPPRARHPHHPTCTVNDWKRTLTRAERWIDYRESRLHPASREPSTGAYGLGQLLPSTYRNLGLPMLADPCDQIEAQRAYERERYGSWRNALAFWQQNGWW